MRFRLYPTCEQEVLLAQHCAHTRFVWNFAVEQLGYRHHRHRLPNYVMQSRQLTEARAADRRRDFLETTSTIIARRYDLIRIEDLRVANMVRSARGTIEQPGRNVAQKAGLNRSILNGAWTAFATRLEDKAAGRVERVSAAFTSQRCSVCGHIAAESRKSQALFRCVACAYAGNADVNAARNIAAGRVVTARGGPALVGLVNREPQRGTSSVT